LLPKIRAAEAERFAVTPLPSDQLNLQAVLEHIADRLQEISGLVLRAILLAGDRKDDDDESLEP
jgi:hypothetical protein